MEITQPFHNRKKKPGFWYASQHPGRAKLNRSTSDGKTGIILPYIFIFAFHKKKSKSKFCLEQTSKFLFDVDFCIKVLLRVLIKSIKSINIDVPLDVPFDVPLDVPLMYL